MDQKLTYEKMSNAKMVTPTIVSFSGVHRTVEDKQVLKRITNGIGLPNVNFSKNLHTLNPSMWANLCEQTMKSQNSIDFLASKVAVIDEETSTIIGITESTNISEFHEFTKKIADDLGGEWKDEIINGSFHVTISFESGTGLYIAYYPDNDWLEVKSFLKFEDGTLYIHPYPIVSAEIADVKFSVMLDLDVLKSHISDVEIIQKYHFEPFRKDLELADLSVAEVNRLLKRDFGIKYTESLSAFDIAAENSDFDARSTSVLTNIFSALEKFQRIALYSPDLKKEVTFSVPAAYYYDLLSILATKSVKYYRSLSNFAESVISSRLNYMQLLNTDEEAGDTDNE